MGKVIVIIMTMMLAACRTSGGTFCDIAEPIRLSEATIAVMTDAEIAKALAHNEKGAALCSWRP